MKRQSKKKKKTVTETSPLTLTSVRVLSAVRQVVVLACTLTIQGINWQFKCVVSVKVHAAAKRGRNRERQHGVSFILGRHLAQNKTFAGYRANDLHTRSPLKEYITSHRDSLAL